MGVGRGSRAIRWRTANGRALNRRDYALQPLAKRC
jgi:hypothetical protein